MTQICIFVLSPCFGGKAVVNVLHFTSLLGTWLICSMACFFTVKTLAGESRNRRIRYTRPAPVINDSPPRACRGLSLLTSLTKKLQHIRFPNFFEFL